MIPESDKLMKVRSGEKEMTCIICPIGCHLHVDRRDDGSLKVTGNKCKRGKDYAYAEFSDPRRTVTATCAVIDGESKRLAVKSSEPVPVAKIGAFVEDIYKLRVPSPVAMGDEVGTNLADTGISVLASMPVGRSGVKGDVT